MSIYLFTIVLILNFMTNSIIFDFNQNSELDNWKVVDDVVMGGESSGFIDLSPDGHGVFHGSVSLANNGGFSSVRHQFNRLSTEDHSKVVLRIKGDGKQYQFRVKPDAKIRYWYVFTFSTNGDWQEIEIPLREMYPSFRGRKLDQPNFSENHLEEIAFLIANKKEESFELLIDKIELR